MTDRTPTTTEEIEEEIEIASSISEHISVNVKSESDGSQSDSIFGKLPDLDSPARSGKDAKLRKLFDISDGEDKSDVVSSPAAGPSKFNIDNMGLDDIGKHFQEASPKRSASAKMLVMKELSPLQDDCILINNSKVSLRDLQHQTSLDNSTASQNNTTNDVSELVRDENTESGSRVQQKIRQWNSWNEDALSNNSTSLTDRGMMSLEQTVKHRLHAPKSPSVELDNGIEEMVVENKSLELSIDAGDLSSLESNVNIDDKATMDKLLGDDTLPMPPYSPYAAESTSEDERAMENMKQRVISSNNLKENLKIQQRSREEMEAEGPEVVEPEPIVVKAMEKISGESGKEALEDISEESEATLDDDITPTDTRQALIDRGKELRGILEEKSQKRHSLDAKELLFPQPVYFDDAYESVVSLTMLTNLENKVRDLQEVVNSKDASLVAQLESQSRRESATRVDSIPPSGRSSTSLATISTEYRTINDECIGRIFDIQTEILERDQLIEQLMRSREQMQSRTEALAGEVAQLKKQLLGNVRLRQPQWMHESVSGGQRLSEISMELVSETDDGGSERNYQDLDEKSARNSRERQLDDIQVESQDFNTFLVNPSLSHPLEQFLKYLSADEWRLFNMVQKKFETFHLDELEKQRQAYEQEKLERCNEIVQLQRVLESTKYSSDELLEVRQELEAKHRQEMEDLRTYFEKKCTEMEKQYSEEVFSQHSRRNDESSGDDISDQENLPPENVQPLVITAAQQVSQALKKRKSKEELYTSPIHRKLTPTTIDGQQPLTPQQMSPAHKRKSVDTSEKDPEMSGDEIREFYQGKINELKQVAEQLRAKLKRFEAKQREEDFMTNNRNENNILQTASATVTTSPTNNEHREFDEIVAEYDRRLQEQVTLAREDAIHELERQIQALLSETASEDSHWPPELILLRERFTAKSQLEIAQLQIKHEEEMARMKADFDKQLQRKLKRQNTFDSSRDLDQIINERDSLRELSATLRWLVGELAKYFSICEKDLNNTLMTELQKYAVAVQEGPADDLNASTISNMSTASTRNLRKFSPNVTSLLALIEDPSLIQFISTKAKDPNESARLDLDDCLEKLKGEALNLLGLSEQLYKRDRNEDSMSDKTDSCEEEDGLKSGKNKKNGACTIRSLDENLFRGDGDKLSLTTSSLPLYVQPIATSELNVQLHELKNRLLKSEDERRSLQRELAETVGKHGGLVAELEVVKRQIEAFESPKEVVSEGYGTSLPPNVTASTTQHMTNFLDLQDKARKFLNASPNNTLDNTGQLVQLVEDFCRASDKFMEEEKGNKEDLQSQIDAADKQLKATRQFLDSQAAEREQERDEFVREIEQLRQQLREKEKEKTSSERLAKEDEISNYSSVDLSHQIVEQIDAMEQQIKEMTAQIHEYEDKKLKMEVDLKSAVDKIVDLREIITELETQIEAKTIAEQIFNEKITELQNYVDLQDQTNQTLNQEVESLKFEVNLEAALQKARPNDEQSLQLEQMSDHLKTIECELDRKTKTLELLHSNLCSVSCSSPSEDVSKHDSPEKRKKGGLVAEQQQPPSLPVDEVQRILIKLEKHNRVEEAAIKRIQDLEMQINGVRNSAAELQHERDLLQDRMSEQLLRISSLQSRLDEQRLRAEDLHRQGTSDLNIRVHDLTNEVTNLRETLLARDKQINNLKSFLENSKKVIDRQELELAAGSQIDRAGVEKLETDLRQKVEENQRLKEKIKNEMINKLALPDLMETMLADKNEEIDHLKERLDVKEQELQALRHKEVGQHDDKLSARTLSDIVSISEYDEPDHLRRAAQTQGSGLGVGSIPIPGADGNSKLFATHTITTDSSFFGSRGASQQQLPIPSMPNFFQDLSVVPKNGSSITPEPVPRQINFSLVDSSNSGERRQRENLLGTPTTVDATPEEHLSQIREESRIEEMEELRGKVPSLEAEVESLKLSLERVASEKDGYIETLKRDLEAKIKEISELQVELQAKSKLFDELIEERKSLNDQLHEAHLKLIRLDQVEAQLRQKEDQIAELGERGQCLEKSLHDKQLEVDNLTHLLAQHNRSEERSFNDAERAKHRMADEIETLGQQIESLNKTISHKDELMAKYQKDAQNYDLVARKLRDTEHRLSERMFEHEKCKIDLSEAEQRVEQLMAELTELERLRTENLKLRNDEDEDIAERVEKELNYSAQLDSNILAAIESDEEQKQLEDAKELLRESEHIDHGMRNIQDLLSVNRELERRLVATAEQLEKERETCVRLQQQLETERHNTNTIQMDDAHIMEAMRMRLESALQTETSLEKMLEEERHKSEQLSLQLTGVHRTKSFDNYLLMKSPDHSRRHHRATGDFEAETVRRLESDIKLLTSQNEREKEHMRKVLELERDRFNKEVADRDSYAEKMKKELNRILKEKNDMESDLEQTQERLALAHQEIDSLEAEMGQLKEAESKRAARRGREHIESNQAAMEVQEFKLRLQTLGQERDKLQETVALLREDLNRGAYRESKLAEALSRDTAASPVPEQFLQRLKEMNQLIGENARENHQMAETLQLLTEERRGLQNRVVELEQQMHGNNRRMVVGSSDDLEDRANHLFGKYLRVESFRKSLVHQKRYLMVLLDTYQENETKALALLNGDKERARKKVSFRRCQSASNNLWTQTHVLQSPPVRERPIYQQPYSFKPLQTPHLLLTGASHSNNNTSNGGGGGHDFNKPLSASLIKDKTMKI